MRVGDLVFTYGTLRRSASNGRMMETRSNYVGTTRINGKIYRVSSWYPGLRRDGFRNTDPFTSEGPTVEGDVFEITNESLPSSLDSYEGYPHLYDRTLVETENGDRVWVYTIQDKPQEDRLIPTGKWEG